MRPVRHLPVAPMQVGDIAKLSGKTVRAIHHYEELGLLQPHARSKGRYRLYDTGAVARVRWINKMHDLGLSLPQIQEIVRTWEAAASAPTAMARMRGVYQKKLEETRAQIEHMRALERELAASIRYLDTCDTCDPAELVQACSSCHVHEKDIRRSRSSSPGSTEARRRRRQTRRRPPSGRDEKRGKRGAQTPDLHGLPRDDARGPARHRRHAAVFQREVRQRGEPQPLFGWTAEEAVSIAREKVAAFIGAKNPKEIVFTSGATESDNARDQGCGRVLQREGQPHRHDGHRAQGRARHVQAPRERGLRGHVPACRQAGHRERRRRPRRPSPTRPSS
jgi:MerR family copper efflux transcriptional regulator